MKSTLLLLGTLSLLAATGCNQNNSANPPADTNSAAQTVENGASNAWQNTKEGASNALDATENGATNAWNKTTNALNGGGQ